MLIPDMIRIFEQNAGRNIIHDVNLLGNVQMTFSVIFQTCHDLLAQNLVDRDSSGRLFQISRQK